MDLKTFKNIEHFLFLIGASNYQIEDKMELVLKETVIYLELSKNEIIFTIGNKLDHPRGELCYEYLLKQIVLEKYYGLPALCMYLGSLLTCTFRLPESFICSNFFIDIYKKAVVDLKKSINSRTECSLPK